MSEYIRREDAVDALDELRVNSLDAENGLLLLSGIAAASDTIESLEPADVAPVVHAHWYILEYESLTCSRCSGFYYTGCDSTTEAKERLKEGIYPKYCPNCGAKMDGERKE